MEQIICLFRVRCQRDAIAALLQMFHSNFIDGGMDNTNLYHKFYSYAGSVSKGSDWAKILSSSDAKNADLDTSLQKSERDSFLATSAKQIVVELVIGTGDDMSAVQYLLLFLYIVVHKAVPYTVLVSGGKSNNDRYAPLSDEDYFRLSHQLYFYAHSSYPGMNLPGLYSSFFVYRQVKRRASRYQWTSLPKRYVDQPTFGRIIPQIPITRHSFRALATSFRSQVSDEWTKLLHNLCDGYYKKLAEVFSESLTVIDQYMDSDSCIEVLLFLGLCCYICEVPSNMSNIKKQDIDSLHETCMSFTQGILQLAENVVIHVLGEDEQSGCGILTVRFRRIEDAKLLYLVENNRFPTVRYFMELYLTDLQYDGCLGIVEKFKKNVSDRREQCEGNPERRKVHSKFYLSQSLDYAEELIDAEEPHSIQKELTQYVADKRKEAREDSSRIQLCLADFLGEGKCTPFTDYISDPENIAFHYGLPILNSIISSLDGYFYVQSGGGDRNVFDNTFIESPYKKVTDFIWNYGTAYVIYIPLRLHKHIGELDYLVPLQHDTCEFYQSRMLPPPTFHVSAGEKKESMVFKLQGYIKRSFDEDLAAGSWIGVIPCDEVVSALRLERLEAYEVIVKSIFLYLVDGSAAIDNLALTNIACPYDVIKIFRLFALFFNRVGRNTLLARKKSFFLVDYDGIIDILFYGNDLKSILDNLSIGRLYGGTTEDAVKIIRHLLEGRHEQPT